MGEIYVVSDIHGELDLFKNMLKKINFNRDDRLIILGDVLDRGPKSIESLLFIMEHENMEMVLGNHEQMFLDYVLASDLFGESVYRNLIISNGGRYTLESYDLLSKYTQKRIVDYLQGLPLYQVVNNYILVHAGLNMSGLDDISDVSRILKMQSPEDLLWSREGFLGRKGVDGYTIIFGHTPTPLIRDETDNPEFTIWRDPVFKDKIGIDCVASFPLGKLACIRLSDEKVFYVKNKDKGQC